MARREDKFTKDELERMAKKKRRKTLMSKAAQASAGDTRRFFNDR